MTFHRHITHQFSTASSRTLGGQGRHAGRGESHVSVAQRQNHEARAERLPGNDTARNNRSGYRYQGRGSGP
jgi:hypothetical protein